MATGILPKTTCLTVFAASPRRTAATTLSSFSRIAKSSAPYFGKTPKSSTNSNRTANTGCTPPGEPVKVRDYSDQNFTPDDEKDFEVKTLREERLIDTVPELDELFEQDMYNLGNADDLPDSDRTLDCQTRGIDRRMCFGKDPKPEIIVD